MKIKKAVLIRPGVPNDATEYTYRWASEVLYEFLRQSRSVEDLGKHLAKRHEVEICLEDVMRKFAIVLFYGHGSNSGDSLIGQDQNALIDLENNHMLKNKICYIIACHSARVLGPDSISSTKGAITYIGFQYEFRLHPPLEKSFGECANAGILKMIRQGCTSGEAKQAMYDQLFWWENRMMEEGQVLIAAIYHQNYMNGDKDNLTILGNQKVRL